MSLLWLDLQLTGHIMHNHPLITLLHIKWLRSLHFTEAQLKL
jgi:hypothetical protein